MGPKSAGAGGPTRRIPDFRGKSERCFASPPFLSLVATASPLWLAWWLRGQFFQRAFSAGCELGTTAPVVGRGGSGLETGDRLVKENSTQGVGCALHGRVWGQAG